MKNTAYFRVDPRLTALLGENYRSSEHAIKELVDNAWDAEATEVRIILPHIMSDDAVVVEDNGSGMKTAELREEYLNIANPRFTRKGERTPKLNRLVKGRKGIGKFAGLILASEMEVETRAQGQQARVRISKALLLQSRGDLEKVPLPFETADCQDTEHGTTIRLHQLNQNLLFPKTDKLREILMLEYGRAANFSILVNGERILHEDIPGESFVRAVELPNGAQAAVRFTIADKPLPGNRAGLVLRVKGKVIGPPKCFGLEDDEETTSRLRRRIIGEVVADSLEDDVTADHGAIIESSKVYQHLAEVVRQELKQGLAATHTNEVNLAKGRLKQEMNRRLEKLPDYRRQIAEERLTKLISRSYAEGESEERIRVLVSLVLDALEMDEYWAVCQKIREAEKVDVFHFADALNEFGICDLAFIGQQARRRMDFLDNLDRLAGDTKTEEKAMHLALEKNLWVFGPEFGLMSSNRTLGKVIEEFTAQTYRDADASKRPDLLLATSVGQKFLLVEFKRPSLPVGRDAESQAKKYRDTLTAKLGHAMDILIVGGEVDPKMRDEYATGDIQFLSYRAIIGTARNQLDWLLGELSQKP